MEKADAKEKRRGRNIASLQRMRMEGPGQWEVESWAKVMGQDNNTRSRSDMARFTR